jgi:PAS domain S-box-containing protein
MRALLGGGDEFDAAPDVPTALRLMGAECPSVVVVTGTTNEAVAASCRELRTALAWQDAVIVAASARPEDVPMLIEAGADDFFVESLDEEVLSSRLLVARRTAAAIAARRAAEQDRAQFFQLSLQLLCIAGFDGYFKMVNPAWTSILGWSSEELLSKPWLHFVHPEDREATLAAGSRLGTGQPVIGFTNRYRGKDGTYRWLEWQSAPVAERGVIYAVVCDVTEARATKEALRELSESLATTLSSIGDGVIATDLTGAVLRMNPVAERLTGWTLAEATGKSFLSVLPILNADTRALVENPIERTLRDGVTITLANNTVLARRDGTEIPIADSCAPIRSSDGTVNGAVLVFRDLTAQRNAEAIHEEFQRQLVFADRMAAVGTLAAGAAHEINNPLSYAAANVDMAIEAVRDVRGEPSPGRMKDLDDMLVEAREGMARVAKIVRGLKTFSRIEEERPGVIDLVPVIELSINIAFNEIRHRARIVKEYGELPFVKADDARLGQVFINLLVNAAHSFPHGNTETNEIRIVTSTDLAGRAAVEVSDNGSGIAPAFLGRVFDPFFTTKPIGIGTGLGLAIGRNIVTAMGGELSVQSELGRGTTFRVLLPPSRSLELSPQAVKTETKGDSLRPAAVLVVDDEPAVGLVIRRVLRQHDVTVVTMAQDALDLLASGKEFDVILTDLMMPGMSGMELYRNVATTHPKIASRVVFVTGGAFTPEANDFLDRVGNERVDKPFDSNQLRDLIQKFVLPREAASPANGLG